ncbi:hypothetical protein SKAU_G00344560 [Synaphobranchus kaupii]|uniref:Uncharacterized protein n=1 Tax=Synaphobranchus kaupii TaxID=118154 RepID=A0A9Q1IFE9_SYNKA|nr:hypothetical protein SKAU_G00344560 [Synaphobranchus kaupii]
MAPEGRLRGRPMKPAEDLRALLPLLFQVLFRYALALLKYREEDILKIRDKVEMYQYLRFFTKTVTDGRYGACHRVAEEPDSRRLTIYCSPLSSADCLSLSPPAGSLMSIAFNGMNPFPMKLLIGRRTVHLERLKAELSELERIQTEYTAQSSQRKHKEAGHHCQRGRGLGVAGGAGHGEGFKEDWTGVCRHRHSAPSRTGVKPAERAPPPGLELNLQKERPLQDWS